MRMRCFSLYSLRFWRARQGGSAVEFALVGAALFLFLLAVVNLGLLGFSLAALMHGVQGAARQAATYAANQEVTNGKYVCPDADTIAGYFDTLAEPPLPSSGTSTGSNPLITATWVDNTKNTNSNEPPGLYLDLTAAYKWTPLGMSELGPGLTFTMSTVATVMGSMSGGATLDPSC